MSLESLPITGLIFHIPLKEMLLRKKDTRIVSQFQYITSMQGKILIPFFIEKIFQQGRMRTDYLCWEPSFLRSPIILSFKG